MICIKCGETRESEFLLYRVKIGDYRCKLCFKTYCREYYSEHIEKLRESHRNYIHNHPEENNTNFKRWYEKNANKHYKERLVYAQSNPQRHRAQCYAYRQLPETQVCSIEGCFELGQRHHDDYNKLYEVRWFCRKHHKELHRSKKLN